MFVRSSASATPVPHPNFCSRLLDAAHAVPSVGILPFAPRPSPVSSFSPLSLFHRLFLSDPRPPSSAFSFFRSRASVARGRGCTALPPIPVKWRPPNTNACMGFLFCALHYGARCWGGPQPRRCGRPRRRSHLAGAAGWVPAVCRQAESPPGWARVVTRVLQSPDSRGV